MAANHFENQNNGDKSTQVKSDSHTNTLYAEVDFGRPQAPGRANDNAAANQDQIPPVDLWKQYGTKDNYMTQAPAEMRSAYGLEANASPEKLMRAVAKDVNDAYNNSPPDVRRLLMQNHGMTSFPKTFDELVKKLADNERAELKLPSTASFADIEKGRLEAHWKKRYIPVDTD